MILSIFYSYFLMVAVVLIFSFHCIHFVMSGGKEEFENLHFYFFLKVEKIRSADP